MAKRPPEEPLLDTDSLRDAFNKNTTYARTCGERFATRRKALGLSRAVVSELADTTESSVIRLEAGQYIPRDYLKLALAAAIGADASDIWVLPGFADVRSNYATSGIAA